MKLTAANYHSTQANMNYMSVSQYKDFMTCERMALAKAVGEWEQPTTNECLVGSFLHAWNEGPEAFEQFKANTPEMFNKNGTTKAAFLFAETMIDTLQYDPICSMMLAGDKEVILTANIDGVPWKIKIDTYRPDEAIVDLKTTRSIWELQWNPYYNCKVSFIEQYDYHMQMAVYNEVQRRNTGGRLLNPYIVAVSKEAPPDKAVIDMADPNRHEHEWLAIIDNQQRIQQIKAGIVEPKRCGRCAYCRSTNVLNGIISFRDLEGGAA